MIAMRVPWSVARADVEAEIRLGVIVGMKKGPVLLCIAGPEWKLVKKVKFINGDYLANRYSDTLEQRNFAEASELDLIVAKHSGFADRKLIIPNAINSPWEGRTITERPPKLGDARQAWDEAIQVQSRNV